MKKHISGKEFYDLINSKTLLNFKWPKHVPSREPGDRQYRYAVYVYQRVSLDKQNEMPVYTTQFNNESEARRFKSITEKGLNRPIVIINKIPLTDEEGWSE